MNDHDTWRQRLRESLGSTLFVLCFGIGLLAFLIAIDRPHWFSLRPMTGVAKAMSLAGSATPPADTTSAGHTASADAG